MKKKTTIRDAGEIPPRRLFFPLRFLSIFSHFSQRLPRCAFAFFLPPLVRAFCALPGPFSMDNSANARRGSRWEMAALASPRCSRIFHARHSLFSHHVLQHMQ